MNETNNYGSIKREECILAVIDMQEKLLPVMHNKDELILNVSRLVNFCAIAGIPVIFTEQDKLGQTDTSVRGPLDSFHAIGKIHFNTFMNPGFSDVIEKSRRSILVLAGVESHICILQTALAGLSRFQVHVISDAISSRSPVNKEIALWRMRDAGAVISSTEMFIYEILAQAGTDEFKSVLPLIK